MDNEKVMFLSQLLRDVRRIEESIKDFADYKLNEHPDLLLISFQLFDVDESISKAFTKANADFIEKLREGANELV